MSLDNGQKDLKQELSPQMRQVCVSQGECIMPSNYSNQQVS